jgi:hypothetical protein
VSKLHHIAYHGYLLFSKQSRSHETAIKENKQH